MTDMINFMESEEDKKLMDEYEKKFMDEYAKRLIREREHNDRWMDRMWERIKTDVDGSIDHMLKWYGSDEYRDREYNKGYQPREELLWVLFEVAETYGKECTEEEIDLYANTFTGAIYRIGSYAIQIMNGQGSMIAIDKIV